MGKVDEFDGIRISVPSGDHEPPHVHVAKEGGYMIVRIADYEGNQDVKIRYQPKPKLRLKKQDQKKALKYIFENWDKCLRTFKKEAYGN